LHSEALAFAQMCRMVGVITACLGDYMRRLNVSDFPAGGHYPLATTEIVQPQASCEAVYMVALLDVYIA
jgi:hypothetical protein